MIHAEVFVCMSVGDRPEDELSADCEREWGTFRTLYRTENQNPGISFRRLNDIGYEPYQIYLVSSCDRDFVIEIGDVIRNFIVDSSFCFASEALEYQLTFPHIKGIIRPYRKQLPYLVPVHIAFAQKTQGQKLNDSCTNIFINVILPLHGYLIFFLMNITS